jgi:ribosomal protein L37AE/L43A
MMTNVSQRIAREYPGRYHPIEMKRVLGLFVYEPDRSCPFCGSSHVHRTKRGRILEFWVLLILRVRPYRCGKCRQRFYGPMKFPPRAEADDLLDNEISVPRHRTGSSRH